MKWWWQPKPPLCRSSEMKPDARAYQAIVINYTNIFTEKYLRHTFRCQRPYESQGVFRKHVIRHPRKHSGPTKEEITTFLDGTLLKSGRSELKINGQCLLYQKFSFIPHKLTLFITSIITAIPLIFQNPFLLSFSWL